MYCGKVGASSSPIIVLNCTCCKTCFVRDANVRQTVSFPTSLALLTTSFLVDVPTILPEETIYTSLLSATSQTARRHWPMLIHIVCLADFL